MKKSLIQGLSFTVMKALMFHCIKRNASLSSRVLWNLIRINVPRTLAWNNVKTLDNLASFIASSQPRKPVFKNTLVIPKRYWVWSIFREPSNSSAAFLLLINLLFGKTFGFRMQYLCLKSAYSIQFGKPSQHILVPSKTPLQSSCCRPK